MGWMLLDFRLLGKGKDDKIKTDQILSKYLYLPPYISWYPLYLDIYHLPVQR